MRDSMAVEALRHQKQLDPDGMMVGVSRQAIDEVLFQLAAVTAERDELREAAVQLLRVTNPFIESFDGELHNARKRLAAIINSPEGREGEA